MSDRFAAQWIEDVRSEFRKTKSLADKAMAQATDEEFFRVLVPDGNSIAIVVKHMAGNMRSRWTDFLTTDGEKPDRHRDTEFVILDGDTRESLMRRWEDGWGLVDSALAPLAPADLDRAVTIRGEPHSILRAVDRQLTHYAYHVGQIVHLARHLRADRWKTLSIPRGGSDAFNAEMNRKTGA